MMAIRFSLNQMGALFKVKVTDCTQGTAINPANITDQKIVFYKPDGTRFEKTAVLVVDPQNPTESFVQYQNSTPEESIFDLIDRWEYDAEITLIPGNTVETSQRRVFWVT